MVERGFVGFIMGKSRDTSLPRRLRLSFDLAQRDYTMALKPCRECGKEISEDAAACANCGIKAPVKRGRSGCVSAVLILIAVLVLVGSEQCFEPRNS